ncbi:carboxylesterase/lipase family protein [Yinghuangia seranimata]|uniref:carboxylesterase/lipase family protein n=1 Tax=Yinghuangia seranimata TaxID=408067 RepID=UPI00248D282C|nr:carboxylesterase family protein [Yinghuangia seranimata]MDI2127739.1 carboxylesterase family protein [Yinghuangia seranimata]
MTSTAPDPPAADSSGPGGEPLCRTRSGVVRGATRDGVAVFRGVPFAAPPVGALRFAAPEPAAAWDGVRPALAFGPPPPQAAAFGMDRLAQHGAADPDGAGWLTLNVWSPAPHPGAGLPVMVWVHGGAYCVGASGLPEYDGARLAHDGGVVVVTFNYRVGVEGFAFLDGAPANRGLLDQVAALAWVRENIAAFGGDPDQVTVFGQSAGAGSVAALLAMPSAAGLFRRAVAQSVPGAFFTPDLAADIAAAVAGELGLPATAAGLAGVDPDLLALAGDAVMDAAPGRAGRWGPAAYRSVVFAPVVDGDVLPATPWHAAAQGAAHGVPLLVGHTRDEQRLFTVLDGLIGGVTDDLAATALHALAPGPDGPLRYRAAFPDAGPEELYERVHSDWLFRMPSLRLAYAHAAAGGRVHLYELAWPAPGGGGVFGACHGLDVPLVFGNLAAGLTAALIGDGPSPAAEEVSAGMRAAWTAFATHGDPGWPAFTPASTLDPATAQVFDTPPRTEARPDEASLRIWDDHAFDALRLEDGR